MNDSEFRGEVLSLLSDGCEIEHSLACAYLYAAMSIKATIPEGLTWEQQQLARRWAAQIYFVASQEMYHLAQIWNLISAIGGGIWIQPGEFPRQVPVVGRVELRNFGMGTLDRFIEWERRLDLVSDHEDLSFPGRRRAPRTVGELYGRVKECFQLASEEVLFVGRDERQLSPSDGHFAELIIVRNRSAAIDAISRIVEQGEGSSSADSDCHHGIFAAIRQELGGQLANGIDAGHFTRPSVSCLPDSTIANPAALFDDVYLLAMRMMAWGYGTDRADFGEVASYTHSSIELMVTVLKPLGDSLFLEGSEVAHAVGPSFRLSRFVPLPRHSNIASVVVREQLDALARRIGMVSLHGPWGEAAEHLIRIARRF